MLLIGASPSWALIPFFSWAVEAFRRPWLEHSRLLCSEPWASARADSPLVGCQAVIVCKRNARPLFLVVGSSIGDRSGELLSAVMEHPFGHATETARDATAVK